MLEGPQPTLTENQYSRYDGVEEISGQWFTKYVAVDYTPEELAAQLAQWRQSTACTPFQGRQALRGAGIFAQVEAYMALPETSDTAKDLWEYAIEWKRTSPMIVSLATAFNMTDKQVDDLFKAAQQITA